MRCRCCAIEVSLAARGCSADPPAWASARGLSRRQAQIAACLAQGLSDRRIATRLTLSLHTVRSYVKGLYGKLALNSRAQVAHYVVCAVARVHPLGDVREAADSPWAKRLGLPPRLARVASCVGRGLTDKQTAVELRLRYTSARTYIKHLYRHVGVGTRAGFRDRPARDRRCLLERLA